MNVGETGGHLTWSAINDNAEYYQIICADTYQKDKPLFGRSLAFIGDADGDQENDDEFVVGCPGWDTTWYQHGDPDDRGGVYMIAH